MMIVARVEIILGRFDSLSPNLQKCSLFYCVVAWREMGVVHVWWLAS